MPELTAADHQVTLRFPTDFFAEHPLTRADLEAEAVLWAEAKLELDVG